MEWRFIDKILEKTDSHLLAIYAWKEEDCAGHFPGNPVVPGIKLVEMACQAGAVLWSLRESGAEKNSFFRSIENALFKKTVRPGDIVTVKVFVQEPFSENGFFSFRAESFFYGGAKDGEGVFSAALRLARQDCFEVKK